MNTQNKNIIVYIPQDTLSIALGADELAQQVEKWASKHKAEIQIVRNGSRGLYWLEPLLEIDSGDGVRLAYGPMDQEALAQLLETTDWHLGASNHPLYLGDIEKHPYLANQERLSFARIGLYDPTDINAYQELEGFVGLRNALKQSPQTVIDEVAQSGLRGRGGAAFPTGIKWQTVADTPATQKYIICNADEGDSGGFSDRMVMEADPFALIESMIIAGYAVGATKGSIYLRSEYPHTLKILGTAIATAYEHGFLGKDILGSGFDFDLDIFRGAGAYICGEETSLLESMEGKAGLVRAKPPLPAHQGYLGQPTVVNNVVTLASVTTVLAKGAEYYANYGMGRSRGTLSFQISGNVKQGGLIEKAFGLTLRELVEDFGMGTLSGRPIKALQVGGPLGAYIPEHLWDTPLDYEAFQNIGGMIGHGGVIVFDDQADIPALAKHAMDFCAFESCGKCTPCRIGSTRASEIIDNLNSPQHDYQQQKELLLELCDTMEHASLCALGGMAPFPVRSLIKIYEEDFLSPTKEAPNV